MNTCCDCKGKLAFGPPLEKCVVTTYAKTGRHTVNEYRCRHCAERHASDLWQEEDQGPNPYINVNFYGQA